jgi:hypothetical protein
MQGVSQTDAPREFRAWPKIFIESCQEFARQHGFKTVKVPRADSIYSYHNPSLNEALLPDARESAIRRIRRDMSLLYDTNAQTLGFAPDGNWFKWANSEAAAAVMLKAAIWQRWFGRSRKQLFALALCPALTDIAPSIDSCASQLLAEPTELLAQRNTTLPAMLPW